MRNSVSDYDLLWAGVGLRNTEVSLTYLYVLDGWLRVTVPEDHTATVSLTLPTFHSDP